MNNKIGNYRLENTWMSLIKWMELKAKTIPWVISLSQWIPWYDMPNELKIWLSKYALSWLAKDYTVWPWIIELRKKMCEIYNPVYKSNLNTDQILITAWAIESITAVILTLVTKETDEIMQFEPMYSWYSKIIDISGAKKTFFSLDKNYKIDFKAFEKSITKNTRLITIVNPSNPTWTYISLEDIEKILKICEEKNIYLLVDEVYNFFIFDDKVKNFSHLKLFDKYKKNLIIINSWSKAFWITWWRIGYILANEFLTKEILKVHDSIVTCAPSHSQYAVLEGMDILFDRTDKLREQLKNRRDYIVEKLSLLSDYIEFEIPNGAYYIFPKFKYTQDDVAECDNILEKAWLAVVPWSSFGPGWVGHFRICYWRKMAELEEWLKRLETYFKNIDNKKIKNLKVFKEASKKIIVKKSINK